MADLAPLAIASAWTDKYNGRVHIRSVLRRVSVHDGKKAKNNRVRESIKLGIILPPIVESFDTGRYGFRYRYGLSLTPASGVAWALLTPVSNRLVSAIC